MIAQTLSGRFTGQLIGLLAAVCLCSSLAFAEQPAPRIVVTGQGSADVAPDMAVLLLTVTREADTARAALTANSAAMAQVLTAMGEEGIAERDLQTSNFSLQPKYHHPPRNATGGRPAPRIVGYTVRNGLTVRVRDLEKVGKILDRSVSLGVNEGGQIQFTNDDPSAVIEKARRRAVQEAMAKARTLAQAAGVELGGILELSEQNFHSRPMPMAKMAMDAESYGGELPIAAGENSYNVSVNLTVAIQQ